jgi:hypothetical protein
VTGLPHTFIGAADRCCPALCDYRPEAVQWYLDVIAAMERVGEDPGEVMQTKRLDRDGGGGADGDRATRIWDVQVAVKELRAAGREVTAESVGRKLCPWALEDL